MKCVLLHSADRALLCVKLQQGCAQVHRTRLDCDQSEEEGCRPRGFRRQGAHPRPSLLPPLAPSLGIRAALQTCSGAWGSDGVQRGVTELVEERPGFQSALEDFMGVEKSGGEGGGSFIRKYVSSARAVAG